MKKIFLTLITFTSIYAIPPCSMPEQNICMYLYKGSMSSEIIITNLSTDKIIVEKASAMLDGTTREISGLKLEAGQNFSMLKSNYEDHLKKPYYKIESMTYKIIK